MWKSTLVSIIAVVAVVASVTSAQAWSEQNCMSMCRLTAASVAAPSGKAQACIARNNCAKLRGRKHEDDAYVQRAVGRWKERNYLVGSMYQGKLASGRTYRHRRGVCPARRHSSGVC
ncbi:MAG: hypothetical protein WCE79_21285 [Xanthobacteraceae bacterium]